MRIIFMGTPEFAVPSLKILVENNFEIVGVVTSTDKWGGRGKKVLLESAVKKYARSVGLTILQPPRLKRTEFIEELRALKADLQVIVAFRMLPEVVWNMPPLGSINLHGSLLPKYRGAAPINWAIINGEKETGVTTFKLKHEIDTGDIIYQKSMKIGSDDTAGDVHDRMMHLGAEVVLRTVTDIRDGNVVEKPQSDTEVTHAPKLFHEDCRIDFNQPVQKVHNFIRGLSPYPCAWTTIDNLQFKIIRAQISNHPPGSLPKPGIIDLSDKNSMYIACSGGWIEVLEAQLQGRKRMKISDLRNGFTPQSPVVT